MGRMLGAFDNPQELDRPDLNKCPDCECYFAGENCPLCGKPCPEEMKAGNRKPPKKEHKRRTSSSGRVYFIEWYHRWWFIAFAMFLMPVVGIVLLVTSPHKKSAKIAFVAVGVVYLIISTIGIGSIIGTVTEWFDPLVDTSLTKEQYLAKCQAVSVEEFYRSADEYNDKFVTMTLTVQEIIVDGDAYYTNDKCITYYICTGIDGTRFEILARNCIQDGIKNLAVGDTVIVYGEGAGNITVYDMEYTPHSAACINVAYVSLVQEQ